MPVTWRLVGTQLEYWHNITETTYSATVAAEIALRPDKSFDYETLTSYQMIVTATDGVATSPTNVTFKIFIDDVNEAPYLNPPTSVQKCVTTEGQVLYLFYFFHVVMNTSFDLKGSNKCVRPTQSPFISYFFF